MVVQESSCDSQAGGLHFATPEPGQWLAAYTRPRHEARVKDYCEQRAIDVFLPTHRSWRQWSDRKKLLALPLFPSYVFIRAGAAERSRIVGAPGFLWFVHDRKGPTTVDNDELNSIRLLLASGWEYDPMPKVEVGDEIEVVRGAMRGCRGFLLQKHDGAIVLQVSAIAGQVRVRLPDPSWIQPLRPQLHAAIGFPPSALQPAR